MNQSDSQILKKIVLAGCGLGFVALVIYLLFTLVAPTSKDNDGESKCQTESTTAITEVPSQDYRCQDSRCVLLNGTSNSNFVSAPSWQLPMMGSGSVEFSVCGPNATGKGLIFYLVNQPTLNDETRGHAFVIDDNGKTYAGDLPHFQRVGNQLEKTESQFSLPSEPDRCVTLCIHYHQGRMVLEDKQTQRILTQHAKEDWSNDRITRFGIGLMRPEENGIVVKDIRVYNALFDEKTCPQTAAAVATAGPL